MDIAELIKVKSNEMTQHCWANNSDFQEDFIMKIEPEAPMTQDLIRLFNEYFL